MEKRSKDIPRTASRNARRAAIQKERDERAEYLKHHGGPYYDENGNVLSLEERKIREGPALFTTLKDPTPLVVAAFSASRTYRNENGEVSTVKDYIR